MEREEERRVERRRSPWREVVGALLERMEEDAASEAEPVRDWNKARAKGASPGRRY